MFLKILLYLAITYDFHFFGTFNLPKSKILSPVVTYTLLQNNVIVATLTYEYKLNLFITLVSVL